MNNEKVVAWCYFSTACMILLLAVFSAYIDRSDPSLGGGKGLLIMSLATAVGDLVKPLFGSYSTAVIFLILSVPFICIWKKKLSEYQEKHNKAS
ncbi:hypothetical protein [Zooshikella ganghwensis]|uniref:Uncharacterized protein n=1 Tax=Zooshikella ganghwensis TaxID=202772 RepID=A0A4P9VVU1_9GAMM|nr:hypothetical protein [Zooshikella ganghwensis]RDH46504.1 hypothetical protein B9G39_25280 [Zooshikella ganghwensis]